MEQTLMTPEERFERIERDLAAMAEMSRQDRADYLVWKRDIKSHIDAIWQNMERRDQEYRAGLAESHARQEREWAAMRAEIQARDEVTDRRIGELVGAIGKLIERL